MESGCSTSINEHSSLHLHHGHEGARIGLKAGKSLGGRWKATLSGRFQREAKSINPAMGYIRHWLRRRGQSVTQSTVIVQQDLDRLHNEIRHRHLCCHCIRCRRFGRGHRQGGRGERDCSGGRRHSARRPLRDQHRGEPQPRQHGRVGLRSEQMYRRRHRPYWSQLLRA